MWVTEVCPAFRTGVPNEATRNAVVAYEVIVCGTSVAAEKLEFPGWDAVMTTEPLPTIVTMLPATVATAGLEEV
ncbi:MAG: hypothetical protein EBU96_07580 [Actinobacteria bacterium]|nr:hypothetical protein [Actinomycetota bacterium]